jgi:hypothetical protein
MCFFGPLKGMEEMLQGLQNLKQVHVAQESEGTIANTCEKLVDIGCHAMKVCPELIAMSTTYRLEHISTGSCKRLVLLDVNSCPDLDSLSMRNRSTISDFLVAGRER